MALVINDTAARVQYTATSGQKTFAVPFEFFANADLKVYRNATLLTYAASPANANQYSASGAGVAGGGSITLGGTGATTGDVLTIVRDVPVARSTDFPTSGPFQIEALNVELSKLTAMVQQQETVLQKRVFRLPEFDTPDAIDPMPVKASRAGAVLAFHETTGMPTVGPKIADVNSVAQNATNIASVAANLSGINTTAANIAAVVDAVNQATAATASAAAASASQINAAASATSAANSASSASISASSASTNAATATTAASTATTKAASATTSAANAATSETNAATSAAQALSAQEGAQFAWDGALEVYTGFDERYLGAFTVPPTQDNLGNALITGCLYWDSTSNTMKTWSGSAWLAAYVSLGDALKASNNLSDLSSASTARTNLGLGNVENKSSATIRGEISSSNVTTALGFTPYNATNPSGYISGITSGMVTTALGFTPYNATNPAGYISGITSGMVTTALGYTPYNASNPSGYITSAALTSYAPLASPSFTGTAAFVAYKSAVVAVSASAIDCDTGNYFTKTAASGLTWTFTNVPSGAYSCILELTNGGTGTQVWPASVKWPGGTAPTLVASGVDILGFITDDSGTTWRGVQLMKDSK